MEIQGKIIGVDLDGVCANFYGRMREIASEWFECDLEDLPTSVTYGLPEWGIENPDEYLRLHRFAVTQRDLFKTSPMVPGARRYLRKLSNEGARIRIITHRLFIHYFHRTAVLQTVDWLEYHAIPYWDLCFLKDKEQVGADIYVDDNPNNVENLRKQQLYTICFANSTNTHIASPRTGSWQDVYHLIHRHFELG